MVQKSIRLHFIVPWTEWGQQQMSYFVHLSQNFNLGNYFKIFDYEKSLGLKIDFKPKEILSVYSFEFIEGPIETDSSSLKFTHFQIFVALAKQAPHRDHFVRWSHFAFASATCVQWYTGVKDSFKCDIFCPDLNSLSKWRVTFFLYPLWLSYFIFIFLTVRPSTL